MKTNKSRLRPLALIGAVLGVALSTGTAGAASLATTVLEHSASLSASCTATNIGTKDVEIEFDVYRYDGLLSNFTKTLIPQGTGGTSADAGAGADRCVFVIKGSAKNVRASLQIVTQSGDTFATTPAQ